MASGRWKRGRRRRAGATAPSFATGAATARALAALGFTDVRVGGGDVGSLKDLVLAQYRAEDGPLLYPAARDRAGQLEAELATRGYDVRAVEAYRAEPVSSARARSRRVRSAPARIDGVLLYSRRTAVDFSRSRNGGWA